MYSEPNLHSRNLKLISSMFILYWALGLTPVDESIRLLVINYNIKNPAALNWVAHILLCYFAWRFYLSSRSRIRMGYRKTVDTNNFTNRQSAFYNFLISRAKSDYIAKHKEKFQQKREQTANENGVDSYNNTDFRINPIDLKYQNNQLCLQYQVIYEGNRLPGNDFTNYSIKYERFHWLWFKAWKLAIFLIGKEETPDYLIPWVLFVMAILTSVLGHVGVTVFHLL